MQQMFENDYVQRGKHVKFIEKHDTSWRKAMHRVRQLADIYISIYKYGTFSATKKELLKFEAGLVTVATKG